MADQPGIDVMRRRIERARRQAPAPRRTTDGPPTATVAGALVGTPANDAPASVTEPAKPAATRPIRRPRAVRPSEPADPLRLSPDAPPVNLAIRVRRPLDDRLAEAIHQLRRSGVRTSKVELIEMLLWEMPEDDQAAVRARLARFREWAPRGTGGPIGDESG